AVALREARGRRDAGLLLPSLPALPVRGPRPRPLPVLRRAFRRLLLRGVRAAAGARRATGAALHPLRPRARDPAHPADRLPARPLRGRARGLLRRRLVAAAAHRLLPRPPAPRAAADTDQPPERLRRAGAAARLGGPHPRHLV